MELTPRQRHKIKILRAGWRNNEFGRDVDGFWYWDPYGSGRRGVFSSEDLRIIAELLHEGNRKWSKEIEDFFKKDEGVRVINNARLYSLNLTSEEPDPSKGIYPIEIMETADASASQVTTSVDREDEASDQVQ